MKHPIILSLILSAFSFVNVFAQQERFVAEPAAPYYTEPGRISVHLHENFFLRMRAVSPLLGIQPEITVVKNVTAGPVFTYFKFKRSESQGSSTAVYPEDHVKYYNLTAGGKASLHINSFLMNAFNMRIRNEYTDYYISVWGGYNFIRATSDRAEQEFIDSNKSFRAGASLGLRSMVGKKVAMFLEAGYSSYAYGTVGFSYIVK